MGRLKTRWLNGADKYIFGVRGKGRRIKKKGKSGWG